MAGLSLTGEAGPVEYRFSTAASFATHRISRTIPFNNSVSAGTMRTAIYSADAEAAYPIDIGDIQVSPFFGLSAAGYRSGNYTESGAGDLSLKVKSANGATFGSSVGVGIEMAELEAMGMFVSPEIGLSWRRAASRQIKLDSEFGGGLDLVRSTTSLLPSRLNVDIGAKLMSLSGQLSGRASLSIRGGAGGQSNQTAANLGLTYTF